MVNLLLKKSYLHKDLKEVKFNDLWNGYGIFTTMRVIGRSAKILFYKTHIDNFITSLIKYNIKKKNLKKIINKLVKLNLKKNKNYDHLIRVASNNKIISISLRKRPIPKKNFKLIMINYKRVDAEFKNLKYKKILKYLSNMDNSKSDIGLVSKKKILETGTSNLLFIKRNKIYTPTKDYYKGNTLKFFKSKIKKVIKKDIFVNDLKSYDEILLVGSGKGIASIKTIKQIGWKRKNVKQFKVLLKYYNSITNKCAPYRFY